MADMYYPNDFVLMYMSEITSRIVAQSGIPSDRYHLGKIILQSLKDDPDFLMQIDGATGESETNGSMLKKSVRCATSMRNMGLKTNDVIVLMAPNHLDLAIPLYAGLYLGLPVAPTDRTMNISEMLHYFDIVKPKMIFCQSEKVLDVKKAVELSGQDGKVISFDKSPDTLSLSEMMEKYGDDIKVEDFKTSEFDAEETIALLISTSGTTGLPKAAAVTHKNKAIAAPYVWAYSTNFPSPIRLALLVSPLQWLSSLLMFTTSPFMKFTRLQTSGDVNPEHLATLVGKYKPTFMVMSPTMLASLVKNVKKMNLDFSCFELIYVGGSAVSKELLQQIKAMSPNTIVQDTYGMSELASVIFQSVGAPPGSCGKRSGHLLYRLIDVETKEDIKEPNTPGELWLKGPGVFKGYYNNPQATEDTFAEDRWLKTGDLMYRDENWNFYFVDRIKLLLKYKNNQISPVELEAVIRQHPGVLDVVVTGVPDPECGDLPVACVVSRPGFELTKQEIKDLVKEKLSDSKQLRGGVLFFDELPLTPSTKVHRRKINEIVMERIHELQLQRY